MKGFLGNYPGTYVRTDLRLKLSGLELPEGKIYFIGDPLTAEGQVDERLKFIEWVGLYLIDDPAIPKPEAPNATPSAPETPD